MGESADTASLLERVGLSADLADRYPRQLSGGQRQRVGVARALAADPPILLMDEPFGALDPITRAEIQREFLKMKAELGKAIVFVTHDIREGLLIGDHIALMEDGELEWLGLADEFQTTGNTTAAALRESAVSGSGSGGGVAGGGKSWNSRGCISATERSHPIVASS